MYQYLFAKTPSGDAPRRGAGDRQRVGRVGRKPDEWHAILAFLVEKGGSLQMRVALSHADDDELEAVRWRPLRTAHYDAERDELELAVAIERGSTLRYVVSSPRCVLVEARLGQRVLRVQDASGLETVIRVRESPAPGSGSR